MIDEPEWYTRFVRRNSISLNTMNPVIIEINRKMTSLKVGSQIRDTPAHMFFANQENVGGRNNIMQTANLAYLAELASVKTQMNAQFDRSAAGHLHTITEQFHKLKVPLTAVEQLHRVCEHFQKTMPPTAGSVLAFHEKIFRKELSIISKIHDYHSSLHEHTDQFRILDNFLVEDSSNEFQKLNEIFLSRVIEPAQEEVQVEEIQNIYGKIDELLESNEELKNSFDSLFGILIENQTERDFISDRENVAHEERVEDPLLNFARGIWEVLITYGLILPLQSVYNALWVIACVLQIILGVYMGRWIK